MLDTVRYPVASHEVKGSNIPRKEAPIMVQKMDIHGDLRQRKGIIGEEKAEGRKLYMRELLKTS